MSLLETKFSAQVCLGSSLHGRLLVPQALEGFTRVPALHDSSAHPGGRGGRDPASPEELCCRLTAVLQSLPTKYRIASPHGPLLVLG